MAAGLGENGLEQMAVLAMRWLPGRPLTAHTMGQALWLEKDYWEKMGIAVANGIARAFKG